MLIDNYEQVVQELLRKDYVIFSPKTTRDLKRDYKELDDYPEFSAISSQELLFVYYYCCRSSPLMEIPEEKRVFIAIEQAFMNKPQQEARKIEYQDRSFPDNIKRAIKVMERFNPAMRIQFAVDTQHLLTQCQHVIRQDISKATPEEREEYLKSAVLARKLMQDILKDVERGNHGVAEIQDTNMARNLEGASAAWHKSRA